MNVRSTSQARPLGRRMVLALLASALTLGVVAMHSMLVTPHDDGASSAFAAAAQAQADSADRFETAHGDAGADHHPEGGGLTSMAADCGPLLATCIALLLSIAGFLTVRRGRSRRVLWQRDRALRIQTGTSQPPRDLLTPLQRTAVLRC